MRMLEYCVNLEKNIEKKLKRSLTEDEINGIRNVGSYLMLDSIDQEICSAKNKKEVEKCIQSTVDDFDSNYTLFLHEIICGIEKKYNIELEKRELDEIKKNKNCLAISVFFEKIMESEEINLAIIKKTIHYTENVCNKTL